MAAPRLVAALAALAAVGAAPAPAKTCPRDVGAEQVLLQRFPALQLHEDAAARRAACEAQGRWRAKAGGDGRQAALPPLKDWPGECVSIGRACFHDGEVVALGGDDADSYWQAPDTRGLEWFGAQPVVFNLPGYFDGLSGIQSTDTPVRARPIARHLEAGRLSEAPVLNVTPVLFFPMFPFNFGDTMGPFFMHTWVQWASAHPEVRDMPLAVALPHNLLLPSFWRLVEQLGQPVESFSQLSLPCGSGPGPLCFERVVGCSRFGSKPWENYVAADGGQAWEAFRSALVSERCPAGAGEGGRRGLVVAFSQRGKNRKLRGLENITAACNEAEWVGGWPLRCETVHLSEIKKDICRLQGIDVLVGIHGAQLVNALFMRPGTSLLEVRPDTWWDVGVDGTLANPDHWSNTLAQKLWLTNRTKYWFYGALASESFPDERSTVPGRDSDVQLSWPLLRCMLERIASSTGHDAVSRQVNAGCSRAHR